jgi:hypothetical protein
MQASDNKKKIRTKKESDRKLESERWKTDWFHFTVLEPITWNKLDLYCKWKKLWFIHNILC